MTKPHGPAERKAQEKDQWGMPPARQGYLRGRVQNIQRRAEPCEYGELEIVDFDLCAPDRSVIAVVQMRGTDFSQPILAEALMDVLDPDPRVRPILARHLHNSFDFENKVTSFYPGRDEPPQARQRLTAATWLLLPLVLLGLAIIVGFLML